MVRSWTNVSASENPRPRMQRGGPPPGPDGAAAVDAAEHKDLGLRTIACPGH